MAGERWERALNEAASRCEAMHAGHPAGVDCDHRRDCLRAIEIALAKSFLISRNWLDSRRCVKEFNLARKLNKRLFGVLIEAIPWQ